MPAATIESSSQLQKETTPYLRASLLFLYFDISISYPAPIQEVIFIIYTTS